MGPSSHAFSSPHPTFAALAVMCECNCGRSNETLQMNARIEKLQSDLHERQAKVQITQAELRVLGDLIADARTATITVNPDVIRGTATRVMEASLANAKRSDERFRVIAREEIAAANQEAVKRLKARGKQ